MEQNLIIQSAQPNQVEAAVTGNSLTINTPWHYVGSDEFIAVGDIVFLLDPSDEESISPEAFIVDFSRGCFQLVLLNDDIDDMLEIYPLISQLSKATDEQVLDYDHDLITFIQKRTEQNWI